MLENCEKFRQWTQQKGFLQGNQEGKDNPGLGLGNRKLKGWLVAVPFTERGNMKGGKTCNKLWQLRKTPGA